MRLPPGEKLIFYRIRKQIAAGCFGTSLSLECTGAALRHCPAWAATTAPLCAAKGPPGAANRGDSTRSHSPAVSDLTVGCKLSSASTMSSCLAAPSSAVGPWEGFKQSKGHGGRKRKQTEQGFLWGLRLELSHVARPHTQCMACPAGSPLHLVHSWPVLQDPTLLSPWPVLQNPLS